MNSTIIEVPCPYCDRSVGTNHHPNSEWVARCSYPCAKLFAIRSEGRKVTTAKILWTRDDIGDSNPIHSLTAESLKIILDYYDDYLDHVLGLHGPNSSYLKKMSEWDKGCRTTEERDTFIGALFLKFIREKEGLSHPPEKGS